MPKYEEEREKRGPGKKDTKKWCRGKVGAEHELQCVLIVKRFNTFKVEHYEYVCVKCGKVQDTWYPPNAQGFSLFDKQQPTWVDLNTQNIVTT